MLIFIYIHIDLTNSMFMRQLPSAWWPSSKVMLKYLGILRWEMKSSANAQPGRWESTNGTVQSRACAASGAILQFLDQPLHKFAFKKRTTNKRHPRAHQVSNLVTNHPRNSVGFQWVSSGFPVGFQRFLPGVPLRFLWGPRPRSIDLRTPSRSMTNPKTRPKPRWFQWFRFGPLRSWADSVAIAIPFSRFLWDSSRCQKATGCDHPTIIGARKIGTWNFRIARSPATRNGTWCTKNNQITIQKSPKHLCRQSHRQHRDCQLLCQTCHTHRKHSS